MMVVSLLEMLLAGFGLIGLLTQYIGPLTIAPCVGLLGLSLFRAAANNAAEQWWIALL